MYLKSLTLKGFKSFADRSVMQLEPGVAFADPTLFDAVPPQGTHRGIPVTALIGSARDSLAARHSARVRRGELATLCRRGPRRRRRRRRRRLHWDSLLTVCRLGRVVTGAKSEDREQAGH